MRTNYLPITESCIIPNKPFTKSAKLYFLIFVKGFMEYKESRFISIKPITFIQFWLQAFVLRLIGL